ncbi:MAG: glycoside hydrolase family 2 protein [bacterium]|nr:glycoside hydrolase family 2 protein [bacterium]
MHRQSLHAGWTFRQAEPAPESALTQDPAHTWHAAAVPGTVHQDLRAAGLIAEPGIALHERDVQWVGERDWVYRTTFAIAPELLDQPVIDLCFDGLDTFASVWLNDVHILTSENMFLPARVTVRDVLKASGNTLVIHFASALRVGKAREAEHQARPPQPGQRTVWNGDPSRAYVRKAGYHYGWDWGPTLLTCGLWRGVRLEAYAARIADFNCLPEVADDLSSATLPIAVGVEGGAPGDQVEMVLTDPHGVEQVRITMRLDGQRVKQTLLIDTPQLWYPNGYGAQPLYRITTALRRDGAVLDTVEKRIGIRKLRLVQEPIRDETGLTFEPGRSFYFQVNNVPVFGGGANWIPADNLIPRISDDRYARWIKLAVDAHMVMLRVWGGGIYEQDVFYDLCDQHGIMVWQDFMFACAMYPAHPAFLASVREEAEANVRLLRHHPSIVLWCGNNEDYQVAQSLNVYDAGYEGDHTATAFPGRAIYEGVLEEVCASLDPSRPYWRGSPYGGADVFDPTTGDRHTWEVWHGEAAPYQRYGAYEGRFVSEFGMQGYPSRAALEQFDTAYPPGDEAIRHHNKATIGEPRVRHYVDANLPVTDATPFDHYAYATRLVQSEAMNAAYRAYRGRWGEPDARAVGGALVWQLNDLWAVTSWALVDHLLHPKPAYYAVKRALAPMSVEVVKADAGDRAVAQVRAVTSLLEPLDVTLEIAWWLADGTLIRTLTAAYTLRPNAVSFLQAAPVEMPQIVSVRLLVQDAVVARDALFPEPLKDHPVGDPEITFTPLGDGLTQVSAKRPAKGVAIYAGDALTGEDNGFDLFPNDPRVISGGDGLWALSLYDLQRR